MTPTNAIALLGLLATAALAKTDYEGCTSFTSVVTVRPEPGYGNTYSTLIWYMTENLEICEGVDCGGGRAPPRTVPGCPAYKGTDTVTPRFLESDPMAQPTTTSEEEISSETGLITTASADVTPAPTPTGDEKPTESGKSEEGEPSAPGDGGSDEGSEGGANETGTVPETSTVPEAGRANPRTAAAGFALAIGLVAAVVVF